MLSLRKGKVQRVKFFRWILLSYMAVRIAVSSMISDKIKKKSKPTVLSSLSHPHPTTLKKTEVGESPLLYLDYQRRFHVYLKY